MWTPTLIAAIFILFSTTCQAFFFSLGDYLSETFTTCQELTVVIIQNTTTPVGVGPYTLLSIEVGGIPVSTPLGNGTPVTLPNGPGINLSWKVPHKAGATLALTVLDSVGNSGGTPNNFYTVSAGSDNSCLPPAPTTPFSVKANVTSSINTCQPWGITVTGGTKPYIGYIAALNQFPTTVKFEQADDALTFINRVAPGTTMMAVIKDANGNFATGTPKVNTAGGKDSSCPGLNTRTGNAAVIQAQNALSQGQATQAAQAKQRTVIIAVVVVIILVLILAGVFVFLYMRKRRVDQGHIEGQDAKSRPYDGQPVPSTTGDISAPVFTAFDRGSVSSHELLLDTHQCSEKCRCGRYNSAQQDIGVGPYSPIASSLARHPSSSAASSYSIGRAITSRNRILPASPRPPGRVASSVKTGGPGGSRLTLVNDQNADIVIQHRDAGNVQELPPPYMLDRDNQAGSSSGSSSRNLPMPPLADIKRPIEDEEEPPAPDFEGEAGPSVM